MNERKSVIVPVYIEKDDIQERSNYKGIKLMSHAYNENLKE